MDFFIFLAVWGAAVVLAQTNHATNTFAYQGCSSVDMSCFTPPVFLNGGSLTPEACQQACQGHRFAALFPTDCRCGDDANAIKPLDEGACNYPCVGDASYGMCGSVCPAEGPGIANVYTKTEAASQEPQISTVLPTSTQTGPASTVVSDDCSSSGQESVTKQSDGGVIPPAASAPDISTSLVTGPSTSTAESLTIPSTDSLPPSGFTTSCTAEDTSGPTTLTVSTLIPQTTTCENGPASFTTSSAELTPYQTTTASLPPAYTSSSQSAPSPQTYSDPYSADQAPTESPVEAPSSTGPSQVLPSYLSASTLWSRPSDVADPPGQPPAPAQVPGSDSTHSMVPPLATIGGLAIIAAIIM